MSQSKMSVTDDTEKKFVIKHVFTKFGKTTGAIAPFACEVHFGMIWKLYLIRNGKSSFYWELYVKKEDTKPKCNWSIEIEFDFKPFNKKTQPLKMTNVSNCVALHGILSYFQTKKYMVDDNLAVQLTVRIKKMTGFEKKKLRNFDKESAEKFSDVVLVVGGEKFYVLKKFLASHSTYFESLLLRDFSESEKSEIELKDIDPKHFQNYLELINGDSFVDDDTVEGILNLADFFDSKTAVGRCEEFLLNRSKLSLKVKFNAAIKCQLEELKKKCISEMKTKEESVLPDDPYQINQAVWQELFKKLASFK